MFLRILNRQIDEAKMYAICRETERMPNDNLANNVRKTLQDETNA